MGLNILVLDDNEFLQDNIRKHSKIKFKGRKSAQEIILNDNPLEYDVLIIDSTEDIEFRTNQSLSEWLRNKNPNIFIIGTSVEEGYLNNPLAKARYDERVHTWPKEVKLKDYGRTYVSQIEAILKEVEAQR